MQEYTALAREVRERLGRVGSGLALLVQRREDDFLALGAELQDVAMRVQDIAADSQQLNHIASGDTVRHILEELVVELDAMQTLCHVDDDARDLAMLARARELVHELSKSIRDYARVVRTLQMLGISTRIESARLGADGRGFSTLADDVEKLGYKIVEYSDRIMQQAKTLDNLAEKAEASTREMHEMQRECAYSVFGSIRDNMDTLHEVAEGSRKASEDVRGHTADISASMGRIIGSLQFHDIVRQQVEHVEEALTDARASLEGAFGNASASSPNTPEAPAADEAVAVELAVAADICALQQAQLENARVSFSDAVSTLRRELTAIAASVRGVGQRTGGFSDATCLGEDCGGTAVLDHMERSVTEIATRMLSLAEQGERMGHVMVEVAEMVAQMSAFLEDIEDVGDEIELIALNASIRAAHTGEKGKALGVLASSIQRLSQDAGESTTALATLLREVDGVAGQLKTYATAYLDSSRVSEISGELEGLTHGLREVNGEAARLFARVGQACAELANRVDHAVKGLDFDAQVVAGLSGAADEVGEMAAALRERVPASARAAASRRLAAMRDRYTMEQERVLHGRVLGGGHAAQDVAAPADGSGDGYGDNVELF
ncbi:methyl-accepting chemotaxis protein [Nitratidesulfovibrio sp. SRB-5]|uniref:methyl-accepting chemotaxis protein n=1 Tax=Nitratidesulfovibrio sp. SRB-5 TaxID=2872636 RepID=UPI0010266AAB|nr:methyl-accepting chemotaxis protein [Nitratidesulfovibrio sp. SRB-5]MBZ2171857.1 methyl-accepting chemotaxis protein [Nitratidesulfovibrio sp. SRB-5]RXF77483.1 methyl-accepting chemotaxis protein [Desulfovibrio sp. DS-1]